MLLIGSYAAGVSQESVLSAALFQLHINDLLKLGVVKYTDDQSQRNTCPVLGLAGTKQLLLERPNLVCLNLVSQWGDENLVSSTLPKHRFVFLALKRANFNHCPFSGVHLYKLLKLLGMELSSDLNFGSAIEAKAQTAAKKLGILHKVRQILHTWTASILYK